MALLTFATGDNWYNILWKILANQGGACVPQFGDTEWELWAKFLHNQAGSKSQSCGDSKYNLLYKIVYNSAVATNGVYPNLYDNWYNLIKKFLINEASVTPPVVTPTFILTETSGYILLENGDKIQLE